MYRLLFILPLVFASPAFSQTALHVFRFIDHDTVSFLEAKTYSIYPLSDRAAPVINASTGRRIKAADYIVDIRIRTKNPDMAAKVILDQLAEVTKSKLGAISNSNLRSAKPATILTGIGKNSVWSVVILPREDGDYAASLSYVIEEESGE